jgi:fatty-acyl-CoA synthase
MTGSQAPTARAGAASAASARPLPPARGLWEPLDDRRPPRPQLSAWNGRGFTDWTWAEWLDAGGVAAAALRRAGVGPGSRVACVLTNSPETCAAVLGIWMCGASIVSMPAIARGMSPPRYVAQLRRICADASPRLALVAAEFAAAMADAGLGVRVASFEELDGAGRSDPAFPEGDAEVFVQYSSGSTSDPRGCVLTADAIAHQLSALEHGLETDPAADVGVSWLPLSHDMGLFGCLLLSYWTGTRLVLGSPTRFLSSPATWFEDCAREQATITVAPNFAFELAVRAARARPPGSVAISKCIVGGERVERGTLRRARDAFGLPESAFIPAYGLAEAVLAVTMTPVADRPRVAYVDPHALASGKVVPTEAGDPDGTALVSAGPPLPGIGIDIDGSGGVGEICVSSPSLAMGYLARLELTSRAFGSGALRSGDLGFMSGGELYVTGRLDDMLCVAGRNVFARDIEAELQRARGIRPGSCAVVDVERDGTRRLVLLAELDDRHPDLRALAASVDRIARETAAVQVRECLFVPRGRLPKTPSGKVQRFMCRELAARPTPDVRVVAA